MSNGVKKKLWHGAIACLLLAGCAIFVLRFSYSTSFAWPGYCGYDSAIFQVIGKGWVEGAVPYVELFDHKGPLIFFVNMLGYALYGRAGILVLQTFSLAVTAWGLYRLGRVYLNRPVAVGTAAVALLYLARTFDEGNMTEEYSLPFLAVSLWLAVRYFKKSETTGDWSHSWKSALVYGASFGAILMLRVTSALAICCFVLVICIGLAARRQWKNLGANALGFVGGFAAATGPFAIYFAVKGALGEVLYGTLWYNFFYATKFSIRQYYTGNQYAAKTIQRMLFDFGGPLLLSLAVCLLAAAVKPKKPLIWASLLTTLGTMYLVFAARPYVHYYMVVTPLLPLTGCLLGLLWRSGGTKARRGSLLGLGLAAVYLCSLAARLPGWGADSFMARRPDETQDYNNVARSMAAAIPADERDSVLGLDMDAQWYLAADITPCQKYFANQSWQAGSDPELQRQIQQLFQADPPKWIVVSEGGGGALQEIIQRDYTPASSPTTMFWKFKNYTLYRHK